MQRTRRISAVLAAMTAAWLAGGCQQVAVTFPADPAAQTAADGRGRVEYDTTGDGRADYAQTLDASGRVVALHYDTAGDGQWDEHVDLDAIDRAAVPHLVIVLDGPPLSALEALRAEGRFRLFGPPARVISSFPAMTDLGMNQLLHAGPSTGYESSYFDREGNRAAGGTGTYLAATNSPWLGRVDYRISLWRDGDAYLSARTLFLDEVRGMADVFARADGPITVIGYSVGTTGMATVGGEPAIREYLTHIDRLCEQIVRDRRGRVSLTITADHGHDLIAGKRVKFDDYLKERGWRSTRSLDRDRDVVTISYGLITCVAFYTRSPEPLADDLAEHEAVDLVFLRDPSGGVIVRKGAQRARIGRSDDGFVYEQIEGDPLKLGPIIERLRADGKVADDGTIDDRALFLATAEHVYPDPLRRLWEAFDGLVDNPADVLVSLNEGWYHGSGFFDAMITQASTHGSLRRAGSETFVLSTRVADLPSPLRQADVLPAVGVAWARPTDEPAP